ncbi:hypothetical protein AVEN_250271-1 [Araneus ventricosus]|uniref:Uncharacterized protein n=1 Tax=Araneus ventricosus TaxID=182803 RepID=A0A4Y2SIK6_ARAVE|nr:hypothetical protein AVEN_184593-1 [Araneus ventricosus]GBN88088.1 hypothetical protein AVEN_170714-1 [Araneus ventricosus]GBN88098.1 hypothetical protein AVEN_4749-1 [Araneus ventricosus]GBN88117.1 hypothetical protein AVEN_250271-1 [Araneus ventricosus]
MASLTKRWSRISILQRSSPRGNWEIQAVETPNHSPLKYFRNFTLHPNPQFLPNCFPLIQEPQITKKRDKKNTEKRTNKEGPRIRCSRCIVLKEVNNSLPEIHHTFYNKCYQLHCFPELLKKGIIVLLHKDGTPVTLLPTIGKVLEEILVRRRTAQR